MATVMTAMMDFNRKYNPHHYPIIFTAINSEKMTKKGVSTTTSRSDLYRAMLKRYSKRYDFSFFEDKKPWGSKFIVTSTIKESIELNEVFAKPYSISLDPRTSYACYLFNTDDGRPGRVKFYRQSYYEHELDGYEMYFDVDDYMGVSGKGDAFRIMATVMTAMIDFNRKYNSLHLPIFFTANTSYTEKGDKLVTSRIDLYRSLLKRYSKKYGFKYTEVKKIFGSMFIITPVN